MNENLREAARGQSCIRCGVDNGTIVLAHYSGVRRSNYGGGLGIKVHDLVGAHLCVDCHRTMDTEIKSKENRWLISEEMQHLCLLTILRLLEQGKIKV